VKRMRKTYEIKLLDQEAKSRRKYTKGAKIEENQLNCVLPR
jgi:hypothetical protein